MANTSMPWVKLYTELLDDPKLGKLPDLAKLRFIQMLLIAGECDMNGCLMNGDQPLTADEIAWRLRIDGKTFADELATLLAAGLVEQCDGAYCIKNFAKRQGRPQSARQAKWRDAQKAKREKTKTDPPTDQQEDKKPVIDDQVSTQENVIDDTTMTRRPREEESRKEIAALAANVSISNSTKPEAENPITRTDDMAQQDNSHALFFIPQRTPAENMVRSWQLPTHLEDLSLEFVRTTGVTPKGGDKRSDKGLYAADAKDWINAGYTAQDFQEAYQRCNGKFPITHLGALFRDVQENKRHAQPKADDDSANMVYTPSGKRVMAQ